jgi:hypothetical protein
VVESGAFRIEEKFENVQRLASVLIDASSAGGPKESGKIDVRTSLSPSPFSILFSKRKQIPLFL